MARTLQVDRMSCGGKRSGQQQVQVSSTPPPKEQTQAKTWPVAYLSDRKETATGTKYKVVWTKPLNYAGPESWDPTWEPKKSLKEDGIGYAMLMVDAWVLARRPDTFLCWARKAVPTLIGANASGTCLFKALQQAVRLLGKPSAVPDVEVESFLAESHRRGVKFSRGIRWNVFKAFLALLKRAGSPISMQDLDFNRQRSGHRGVPGIKRLKLEDGFYIVAASNTMGVGHAFVLEVQGRKYTAHDGSVKRSLGRYAYSVAVYQGNLVEGKTYRMQWVNLL
uniref:Chromo domain-containing protein n=1 Tax=Phytophthora ramorum TaxID=164328 RepID=H3H5H5_PHYRM